MDLSIIVVTWNTRALTLRCLEELEREGLVPGAEARAETGLDVEVFVVDNGSRDETSAAIAERCPWVELVTLPENGGFARGNNAALPLSRGRVVLLLNSDARMTLATVRRCLEVLEGDPKAGVVGPQLVHEDGRLQNSVHAFPSLLTELVHTALLESLFPQRFPSKRYPHAKPLEVDAVLGASLFVRREVIDKVGGLPEDYFFFLEETDWCWRIRKAGWKVLHVPDVRVVHLSGASSKSRDAAKKRIEYHRSLYHFLETHRGPATKAIAIATRTLRLTLSLLLLSPLALFSKRQKSRQAERSKLLAWHLKGRPQEEGLRETQHPN